MESFQLLRRRTTELFHSLEQTLPSSKGHGPHVPTMKATWEKLQLPPLPRSSHSADVVAGTLYIFGGEIEPRRPLDNDMHAITLPASGAPADYYAIKAKSAKPAEPVESKPANPAEAVPAKPKAPGNSARAEAEDTGSSAASSSEEDSSDEDEEEDDDDSDDDSSSEEESSEEESSSDEEEDSKKKKPSSASKGKAPATAADTPLPDVPPPRVGHASAVIGHRIFIFGGRGGPEMSALDERGRVWVFDTRTHLWSYLDPRHAAAGPAPFSTPPPYPAPRSYHAAVATPKPDAPQTAPLTTPSSQHKPSASDNSVEAWRDWALGTDPEKAATFGTPQHPVVGVLAERAVDAESDGYGTFIIHGGCLGDGSRAADVWAFDVRSRVWQRLPDAPGPARGGAALALSHRVGGGRLYRFGGFDGKTQQGGQLDILPLGLDVFDDQVSRGEAVLVARSGAGWQSVLFGKEDVGYKEPDPATTPSLLSGGGGADNSAAGDLPFPGNRSVASMEVITTGGGREYLIVMFGEREASGVGHAKAGRFWEDVWALPLQADGLPVLGLLSSLAGKAAGAVSAVVGGRRSRSGSKTDGAGSAAWYKVETRPHDDEDDASVDGPGPRGWVASSPLRELEENAVVVFGGLDEGNRRLGDAWILRLE
ncbi:hypothetical protein VTJ49DRAFT_4922 [Mycothermus thermophilus]|uniref:Uncharacterized protein n=1 Tax=Humicola insolens TaxID=85995 RepID=A0ABR3V514_HUMIN